MRPTDQMFAFGADWVIRQRDGGYWLTYLSGHFQTREETIAISEAGARAMKSASPLYFDTAIISMPHRHCVRYQRRDLVVDYEVEIADGALIVYTSAPNIMNGTAADLSNIEEAVLAWLNQKFSTVVVDRSPPPIGF